MTEEGQGRKPLAESASEFVASRRNVLRTATGLAAAAVVGGALAAPASVAVAAGPTTRITCDIQGLGPFAVLSFSWGLESPINIGSQSTGAGAGKVTFQDMALTRYTDALTPELFNVIASGAHFDKATLTTSDASGKAGLVLELSTVFISSLALSGSENAAGAMTENLKLIFGQIKVTYQNASHGWDQTKGTGA